MPGEVVIEALVKPSKSAVRVGAEMAERLQGRLKARVETEDGIVRVHAEVAGPEEAAAAREVVRDVVQGVRQTIGLNALDREERISITIK